MTDKSCFSASGWPSDPGHIHIERGQVVVQQLVFPSGLLTRSIFIRNAFVKFLLWCWEGIAKSRKLSNQCYSLACVSSLWVPGTGELEFSLGSFMSLKKLGSFWSQMLCMYVNWVSLMLIISFWHFHFILYSVFAFIVALHFVCLFVFT